MGFGSPSIILDLKNCGNNYMNISSCVAVIDSSQEEFATLHINIGVSATALQVGKIPYCSYANNNSFQSYLARFFKYLARVSHVYGVFAIGDNPKEKLKYLPTMHWDPICSLLSQTKEFGQQLHCYP